MRCDNVNKNFTLQIITQRQNKERLLILKENI